MALPEAILCRTFSPVWSENQPLSYFEYRNWGPARRVGSPKDNIEQGISNSRSFHKQ
jgi:hypothetical protein